MLGRSQCEGYVTSSGDDDVCIGRCLRYRSATLIGLSPEVLANPMVTNLVNKNSNSSFSRLQNLRIKTHFDTKCDWIFRPFRIFFAHPIFHQKPTLPYLQEKKGTLRKNKQTHYSNGKTTNQNMKSFFCFCFFFVFLRKAKKLPSLGSETKVKIGTALLAKIWVRWPRFTWKIVLSIKELFN